MENIIEEKYKYTGEGELIQDRPSVSLNIKDKSFKKKTKKEEPIIEPIIEEPIIDPIIDPIIEESIVKEIVIEPIIEPIVKEEKILMPVIKEKTNKELYENLLKENKNFNLIYKGNIIFNSSKVKNLEILKFNEDGFELYGKRYSYLGLSFKFEKNK